MEHYDRSTNYVIMATNGFLVMSKILFSGVQASQVLFETLAKFNYQASNAMNMN